MRRRSLLATLALAACERPRRALDAALAPPPPDVEAPREEDFPVVAPPLPPADAAQRAAWAALTARVAERLWRDELPRSGNVARSPEGVAVALAMTAAVARPEAASEVEAWLGGALRGDALHAAAGAALRRAQGFEATTGRAHLARLFAAQSLRLDEAAMVRLRTFYGAPVARVKADAVEGARARVRDFLRARTRGAFDEVLDAAGLVPETPAALVSVALARVVVGERVPTTFRVGGAMTVDLEGCAVRAGARAMRGERATWVELALDGDSTLGLLVPDEGVRLAEVEGALLARRDGAWSHPGDVVLPALRVAPTPATRLRAALWAQGLACPFDPRRDPLAAVGMRRRWLSELFHAGRFELRADAPAAGPLRAAMRIDRPFAFTLRDGDGAVTMLGRVADASS